MVDMATNSRIYSIHTFPLSPYPLILIRTCSLFQNNPLSNLYQTMLFKSQHKQCPSCGWNAALFLLPGFSNLSSLLSLLPELQLLCPQASLMKRNLSLKGLFRWPDNTVEEALDTTLRGPGPRVLTLGKWVSCLGSSSVKGTAEWQCLNILGH